MEIRNAIMKKFHMNPQSRVEPNDLVGLSIGNSEARRQVMEFLDHWGLINFQPFPLLDSTMSAANVDEVAKTASLIEKLYHFQEVQLCPRAGSETNISELTLPSQLLPESPISENLLNPDGLAVEYHCNACSTDCSKKRYHCQTKVGLFFTRYNHYLESCISLFTSAFRTDISFVIKKTIKILLPVSYVVSQLATMNSHLSHKFQGCFVIESWKYIPTFLFKLYMDLFSLTWSSNLLLWKYLQIILLSPLFEYS